MNKIFRKAITVLGSVALIGATVGAAAAASYPAPFTSNTAIVVGANAAPSDTINGASLIADDLDAVSTTGTSLTGGEGVTENEVVLGSTIISGKVLGTSTDTKLPALLDKKITWDNGTSSEDYNIHEEIIINAGKMLVKTSFDDNDLEGLEMSNDEGFAYHYVFDDAFPTSRSSTTADDLYLEILGKSYEITAMTATSITVVTSEEVSLGIGDSATVDGKTFTVDDVFDGKAQVNGEIIAESSSKKIDGVQVEVNTVGYHSNAPELSKVILRIGNDISKTYSDGEEFIGEPDVDFTWEWDIANLGSADGYIGAIYSLKETREKDDMIAIGGSYILPNNYAAVSLDAITDVDYANIKISFEEDVDLYNATDGLDATVEDAEVMVIEAVSGEKDAFKLDADTETNKIYVRWATNLTSGDNMSSAGGSAIAYGTLEVLYEDVNNIVGDSVKPRYFASHATALSLGNFTYGDTEVAITGAIDTGRLAVSMVGTDAAQDTHTVALTVGGPVLANQTGDLTWIGTATTTTEGNAEVTDVSVGGTDIGTKDNDIMTYDGFILMTPEANAEDDVVVLSIPSDKVYATVSVVAGGDATTEAGVMTVKDTEVASVSGKNLIVVGGSAINNVAAELLDGAFSEGAFTTATGVGAGEFLIQSFDRSGKTALLVAGYNPEDTEKAVTALLNSDVDTTVGMKYVSQSTTVSSTDLVTV